MKPLYFVLTSFALFAFTAGLAANDLIPFQATGVNATYSPVTGDYSSPGVGTPAGQHDNTGTVKLKETGNPLVLRWKTKRMHVVTDADGDQIFMKGGGLVNLIPIGGDMFIAEWDADFNVVVGTGKFKGIKRGPSPLSVSASNDPFTLADPVWTFSWEITGEVRLDNGTDPELFKVAGDGLIPELPLPLGPAKPYFAEGTATPLGNYVSAGNAQINEVPGGGPAIVADFSSGSPTIFTDDDGSELHCNFAGYVQLIPASKTTFETRWVAEFTPAIGESTGAYENVSGGSLLMIATTDAVSFADVDIPFSWTGCGHLIFDDD